MERVKGPISSLLAFMADLHHEIRSPVNTILNMTELALKDSELTPSMENYFRTIERAAGALLTILDDVIELSQDDFESSLKEQGFGITDMLEDFKEAVQGLCAARGTHTSLSIDDVTPEWFTGPRGRMRQVLTQVFNYAVRQLGAPAVHIGIGYNADPKSALEFKMEAEKSGELLDDVRSIAKNPRILICQRLLAELDRELKIEQVANGVEFKFSMNVRPLDMEWGQPIFPTPVSCLVGEKGLASTLVERRLSGCGFEVRHAPSLHEAQEVLAGCTNQSQKAIVVAEWDSGGGALFEESWRDEDRNGFPTLFYDIPAIKMMELSTRFPAGSSALDVIGFVMAPSRGKQLLSEVLRLLRMEPDQLSCPVLSEDGQDGQVELSPDKVAGMKVLVVEDDRINQKIVVELLKKFGVKPVVASTGNVALKAVKKYRFDAIFMDINLPDTDGYRLTEEIRGLSQYKDVPIIALTASTKNRSLCMEAGMDYFLSKPYSEAKLLKSLLCTKKE